MEFQAIVMAGGRGSRMNELTSSIPKCLLPVGNRPLIYFPVRMLEKAGFNEINIVTLNSIKSRVESELKINCGIKSTLNIVGIDDVNEDDLDDFGTANALSLLKDKIVKDCIIVSGDLISNVNIQMMTNFYRINNPSLLMLLSDTVEQSLELPVPGSKGKFSPERDILGLDAETNRIVYFSTELDVEEIKLKSSILQRFPKLTWTTKLQDAHLYIIKKSLIDYITDNKKISSLRSDFLPFLAKKQFSINRSTGEANNSANNSYTASKKLTKPKLQDYVKVDDLTLLINKSSNRINDDLVSFYGFIQADGFCYKTNNIAIYSEANRQLMSKILPHFDSQRAESLTRYDRSQIGSESLICEGSTIGEKAQIKRSIIGRNCKIGEKVKIINSVLMDNVTVAEGVTLQGTIICSDSKINQKSELKDCLVGYNQDIITTGKYSNETIQDVDSFMDD